MIWGIVSHKGGTGKTVSTFFLSFAAAERGMRVLAVDLDPQAHLTDMFGVDSMEVESGVLSLFRGGKPSIVNVAENIDLLPSSGREYIESYFTSAVEPFAIVDAVEAIRDLSRGYDLVLLDSSPDPFYALFTMRVADYVIVPTRGRAIDVNATVKFLGAYVRRRAGRARVLGVLVTMHYRDPEKWTRIKRTLKELLISTVGESELVHDDVVFTTSIPVAGAEIDSVFAAPNAATVRRLGVYAAYRSVLAEALERARSWTPLTRGPINAFRRRVMFGYVTIAAPQDAVGKFVSYTVKRRDGTTVKAGRAKVKRTIAGNAIVEIRVPKELHGEVVDVEVNWT